MALVAGEAGDCHPGAKRCVVDVGVVEDPVGRLGEHDASGRPSDGCVVEVGGVVGGHRISRVRGAPVELRPCNSSRAMPSRILRGSSDLVRSGVSKESDRFVVVEIGTFSFDCVMLLPMSSVREFMVDDPELGLRRAYSTATVAEMANVTQKTITSWVSSEGTASPVPLRGWAPKSEHNRTGRWLIDADMADTAFSGSTNVVAGVDIGLRVERERLEEERAVFELERRVFEESRIEQLENENAQLRARCEKLSSQVSTLGGVIRELTEDAQV